MLVFYLANFKQSITSLSLLVGMTVTGFIMIGLITLEIYLHKLRLTYKYNTYTNSSQQSFDTIINISFMSIFCKFEFQ